MTSGQAAGQGLPHRRLNEMTEGGKDVVSDEETEKWGCDSYSTCYYLGCCVQERAAYLMSSSCRSSWLAWKMGFLVKSSPRIHLIHDREWGRGSKKIYTRLKLSLKQCQSVNQTGL